MRIVRAILSLLEAALRDEKTTHILLCTESCIPVATLRETARSILLDEICPWEEEEEEEEEEAKKYGPPRKCRENQRSNNQQRRRLDWNRSYIDCYDRNSSRCTRFDEREYNSEGYRANVYHSVFILRLITCRFDIIWNIR